jgi:hypothetical protein
MAETAAKPSWQAQVAFYLSLMLAAFQIFQFWHSGKETTIVASIELARSYLSDQDISRGRRFAINVFHGMSFTQGNAEDAGYWNKFILNAGYVATLLEEHRLDRAYLPKAMICDIWLARYVARKLPGTHSEDTNALDRIAHASENDCALLYPPPVIAD